MKTNLRYLCCGLLVVLCCGVAMAKEKGIAISEEYPSYWAYKGKPTLLIGGSVEDNLFQIPNLEAHLDLLQSVGGNYVRCTMSSRDEGNVWAFLKTEKGYDLEQFNPEYWQRFEQFLKLTAARDIMVQIEVWATFDFYQSRWPNNPFNPTVNINYTAEETGLPTVVDSHPVATQNNFFWSVPAERNQKQVLKYQQKFVNKLLHHSLKYGNVLYCMDNETSVTAEWGKYWATFMKERAAEKGVKIYTTEMWDPHNLDHPMHNNTFDHPETYDFVDISQNNHQKGQQHWDNAQKQRQRIAVQPRPLNCVKIYGSDAYNFGKDRDGIERFWRNVFGGMASARFHRPPAGLGLNEIVQAHLQSMRAVTERINIFNCEPHNDLLGDREENEAYCTAEPGKEYAVYFPQGGSVNLDLTPHAGKYFLQWLNVDSSTWEERSAVQGGATIPLNAPSNGYWVAVVTQK